MEEFFHYWNRWKRYICNRAERIVKIHSTDKRIQVTDETIIPDDGDQRTAKEKLTRLDPSEDGRGKEWEDRARVNLEEVGQNKHTNVERDFEPEELPGESDSKKDEPAY